MKKYFVLPMLALTFSLSFISPVYASRSKPFTSQKDAENYLKTHYYGACRYYSQQEWRNASDEFEKVIYFFPDSAEAAEARFFLGICFFEMKELDFASASFSNYLTSTCQPEYFEEAVYYKYCIAEHLRCGKKRRPFTYRYFPKWLAGESLALTIYDEIVIALPNHELSVCALYSKGELLQKMGNFREAVDTYQILIRRFPKHEITPTCYLKIAQSYCQQSVYEFQNPDILALAELNARKFKDEFPRDDKIDLVDGYVRRIKEMYAKGLCDVGLFYERMCHPEAAVIYYQSSVEEFPETRIADFCRKRLACLGCDEGEENECENEGVCEASPSEEPCEKEDEQQDSSNVSQEGESESDLSQEFSFYQQNISSLLCYNEYDEPIHYNNGPFESINFDDYENFDPIAGAIQEEQEGGPAPYYLHYSLMKKKEVERRDRREGDDE